MTTRAVLDTNVFVAAGFRPDSAPARLLREAEAGRLALVWSRETRGETEAVLRRIPKLRWERVAALFRPEGEHEGALDLAAVGFVEDAADRKFAALSRAAGAPLVSADDHLLAHRGRLDVSPPGEFLRERLNGGGGGPDGG